MIVLAPLGLELLVVRLLGGRSREETWASLYFFRMDVSVGLGAGSGGSLWYPPRLVTVVRARWSPGGDVKIGRAHV